LSAAAKDRRPTIVLVGGFLGAGKTTLILEAARILEQRGLRSAVILNDQGEELVDTQLARQHGLRAGEVTGGCFCCRLSSLTAVIDKMREFAPDVLFAEPVGSCTDISATVLNPLREEFERYRVAPFSVLVDPARAAELLEEGPETDLGFLFHNQLAEADLVCLTKSDLYPDAPEIPGVVCARLSAKTGEGVARWLDEVLLGSLPAGGKILEIDYTRYAEAEAALAWLNLSFQYEPHEGASPALVIGPLLDGLDRAMTAASIPIVHLKAMDSSPEGWLKAALCANGAEPRLEGSLDASPSTRHQVLVNLRAQCSPDAARRIAEEELGKMAGTKSEIRLDCFSPSPPKPERRAATPFAI